MPRFQLVIIGEGRFALVAKMLHPLGFVNPAGTPGPAPPGAALAFSPLPQAKLVGEKAGKMGVFPFTTQLRFAPGTWTVCVLMPDPLGATGPLGTPLAAYSMDPVGIASIPICPPGKVPCSPINCAEAGLS